MGKGELEIPLAAWKKKERLWVLDNVGRVYLFMYAEMMIHEVGFRGSKLIITKASFWSWSSGAERFEI